MVLKSSLLCFFQSNDDIKLTKNRVQTIYISTIQPILTMKICSGAGVTSMAWSAEKFKLEEEDDEDNNDDDDRDDDERDDDDDPQQPESTFNNRNSSSSSTNPPRNYVLAVCLADGNVVLLRSFDDLSPVTICTGLRPPLQAEWSNSRKLLAIAGIKDQDCFSNVSNATVDYTNLLKFYSDTGVLIYTIVIPYSQVRWVFKMFMPLFVLNHCSILYN